MTTDTLIFKDKKIRDNSLKLTFHKDVYWIYNENPLPVVMYTLTNCKNIESINFDSIEDFKDFLVISTNEENGLFILVIEDLYDAKLKIVCNKIEKEEREYNNDDYTDLIKEILKQRDNENDKLVLLIKNEKNLQQFLNHKLDIVTRKFNQADWLTKEKKQFLLGQEEIIKTILERMNQI